MKCEQVVAVSATQTNKDKEPIYPVTLWWNVHHHFSPKYANQGPSGSDITSFGMDIFKSKTWQY